MHSPKLEVVTESAGKVWEKGDRAIYEVVLQTNNRKIKVKTYSKQIAQIGFSGEVEAYEKPSRNGTETFVRQVRQDSWQDGNNPVPSQPKTTGSFNSDPYTMYLSYAKDILVALVGSLGGDFNQDTYKELLEAVSRGGKYLYNNRIGVTENPSINEPTPQEINNVKDMFGGGAETVVDDDPFAGLDVLPKK